MFQDQDHLSSRHRFRRRTTLVPGAASVSSEAPSGHHTQSADWGKKEQRKRVRLDALFAGMDDAVDSSVGGSGVVTDLDGADTVEGSSSNRDDNDDDDGDDDHHVGKESGGDIELRDYSNNRNNNNNRHIDSVGLSFHGRKGGKRGKTMFSSRGSGSSAWKKSRKLTFLGDAFVSARREEVDDTDNDEDHMISTEYHDQDIGEDDQVLGALSITGVVAEDEWFCPLEELMLDPSEPVIMRRALNKHQGIYNMRAVRLRQLANIAGYVLFVLFVVLVWVRAFDIDMLLLATLLTHA